MWRMIIIALGYHIYMYKFTRDVIFAFAGNLSFTKIKSSKFFRTIIMHTELKA